MSLATLPLPDDPTALRNLAVDLQAELARKDIEIAVNAAERGGWANLSSPISGIPA